MGDTIIKIESLSKQYRLGNIGTGTLSHDLKRWFTVNVRGKEDPYLKIGSVNDTGKKADGAYVWALRNIDLEVKQGEVLGIIGKNGAGKSTLLKILSRVTSPTTGIIRANGRIASLLEVGTGFHIEMTGRENIFMNGSIMGMTKAEIRKKFDEIVEFAGVARYIDTPVKRYSSGMTVRLGFAIAAHLEPEILVVDEVLAVGDAEFQKKAIGKMHDVSQNQGRTVLFVSHNMGAVDSLCNTGIVLKNGMIDFQGTSKNAIDRYLNSEPINNASYKNLKPRKDSDILEISTRNSKGDVTQSFRFNEPITIVFQIKAGPEHMEAILGFRIKDQRERNIFTSQCKIKDFINGPGIHEIKTQIPANILVPNNYSVIVGYHIVNTELIRQIEDISFEIEETGTDFYQYSGNDYGCVFIKCVWDANSL